MQFDSREFRNALGRFPTGVIIVTAFAESELIGMTMSSFNSVSLDPPLVLFSVHRGAVSFPLWKQCTHYAINILGEGQESLSNRFATSKGEKWNGLTPVIGRNGTPFLADALVAFECETYATYDGGDHEIFVARVVNICGAVAPIKQPLLFYDGRYRKLAENAHPPAAPIDDRYLHGW